MPCVTQMPPAVCVSAEACLLGSDLTSVSSPEARSSSYFRLFKSRTIYTQAPRAVLGVEPRPKTNSIHSVGALHAQPEAISIQRFQ